MEVNATPCFRALHAFATGKALEIVVVLIVVVNTIVLMMDMYPIEFEATFGVGDGKTITYDRYVGWGGGAHPRRHRHPPPR